MVAREAWPRQLPSPAMSDSASSVKKGGLDFSNDEVHVSCAGTSSHNGDGAASNPSPSNSASSGMAASQHDHEHGPQIRRRRPLFMDQRYRAADIGGLRSRDFEVDLLAGERLFGEPMRVRLTKTMSSFSRILRIVLTFGLYEVWQRCCATGSQVFDADARLAITSRGRLLLWTHTATGGNVPLLSFCCQAIQRPVAFFFVIFYVLLVAFVPAFAGTDLYGLVGFVTVLFFTGVVITLGRWMLEQASLTACTSVRQFDVRDLSLVRLVCYSRRSFLGWGGEVTSCQVRLFFGVYPRPAEMEGALPCPEYDSGSVRASFNVAQARDNAQDRVNLQAAAGMSTGENASFVGIASFVLVLLAFAAFLNEATDFMVQLTACAKQGGDLSKVSGCTTEHVRNWWTGSSGDNIQTVLSHWIDTVDWSLQLVLFLYVAGPALAVLWDTMSESSGAGIGFIVDRRRGTQTEDERFEEHWHELADFLSEIFGRACGPMPEDIRRALDTAGFGAASSRGRPGWDEIEGDTVREPGSSSDGADAGAGEAEVNGAMPSYAGAAEPRQKRASWTQVEESTARLLDPMNGNVRVYKAVLSWLEDERILAVYPERVIMGIVTKLKIALTCGLEYACRWRRQRREGALILTDRRLMQVSAFSGLARKSIKVDMFMMSSVKYMAIHPARVTCCAQPRSRVVVATRCGVLEVELRRVRSLRLRAQALWQGLALLQDVPGIQAVELDDWASVLSEDARDAEVRSPGGQEAMEQALGRVSDLWGSAAQARLRDAIAPDAETGAAPAPAALGPEAAARQGAAPLLFDGGAEAWGLSLTDGERIMWGPAFFEQEVLRPWCWFCRRQAHHLRRPSALVALTDRRLAVIRFDHFGSLCCWRLCGRSYITSVAVVPLCSVLGFSIEEVFSMQRAFAARLLGRLCCRALSESVLTVRTLTNAGMGKNYLNTLHVHQHVLPRTSEAACTFEEDKILELRRWLGNVALFFSQGYTLGAGLGNYPTIGQQPDPLPVPSTKVDVWRCPRGWAPA